MKQISNKEFEKYQKYLSDKAQNRFLTSEGIRFICESCHYNPTEIGQNFLELLPSLTSAKSDPSSEDNVVLKNKYWLQAETEAELNDLLYMFWSFHDFRIERIDYSSAPDRIDLLLEYDTHEFRVLLRFIGNVRMNFLPVNDYAVDWLTGASLGRTEQGQLFWAGDEDIEANDLPKDVLWITGDCLHFALLDDNGNPRKLPEDLVHQVWHHLNYDTGKYEDIDKEFHPRYIRTEE